jgi:sarcosine oxidase gamma subunit
LSFQRSDDGALRVRGPARDVLPVGPGVWAVLVAVGRPADVERAARALELSDEAPADVHVLRTSVRVAEPRP